MHISKKQLPDDPATNWAIDVVEGHIVAGKFVISACRRHLNDLTNGAKRGLRWDPEKAAHALNFFPACLTITAGAAEGQAFNLLPWHEFVVGSLFGWVREDGRLRFRKAWFETGKGQAKSPLMAAIGLYLLGFYGIRRSEIYAIGQDRSTANVLFRDAVAMCRAPIPGGDETDTLEARDEVIIRGAFDNAWKIEHPDSGSKFQALANSESISGPRPTAVLADEIHEFKSSDPIETWARAIAKMPGDAIMILGTNTPASTQIVGTGYSEFFQRVATGEVIDDEAFSFIARVDPKDRETVFDNEACWAKALPALDVTFPRENIRGEVNTARVLLSTAMSVKRLYFGIPTGAIDFWIDEEAWSAVLGEFDIEEMRGLRCWLSLDLSQKNDLTAKTAIWEKPLDDGTKHYYSHTWYWTTREGIADRAKSDNAPYEQWVEGGYITAVPGSVIDKTFIAQKVAELRENHDIKALAYDVAGIGDFLRACEEIGLPSWRWEGPGKPPGRGMKLLAHAQGTRVVFEEKQLCMPRSIERFEDLILKRRITIQNSPVSYMCAANAALIEDGQKNRAFDKKRSRGRIDGLVTNAMGAGAATADLEKQPEYRMMFIG